MPASRSRFLVSVVSQIRAPYVWNAKGQIVDGHRVFDCSGLVTWSFLQAGGPDWRGTHNSDGLFAWLPPVEVAELQAGDLLFWGTPARGTTPADPEHVGVYLGGGVLVSAAGGGRHTLTLLDAAKAGAMVRAEASIYYRPGFLGARRLPWSD